MLFLRFPGKGFQSLAALATTRILVLISNMKLQLSARVAKVERKETASAVADTKSMAGRGEHQRVDTDREFEELLAQIDRVFGDYEAKLLKE